jgi:hypothetical protein
VRPYVRRPAQTRHRVGDVLWVARYRADYESYSCLRDVFVGLHSAQVLNTDWHSQDRVPPVTETYYLRMPGAARPWDEMGVPPDIYFVQDYMIPLADEFGVPITNSEIQQFA